MEEEKKDKKCDNIQEKESHKTEESQTTEFNATWEVAGNEQDRSSTLTSWQKLTQNEPSWATPKFSLQCVEANPLNRYFNANEQAIDRQKTEHWALEEQNSKAAELTFCELSLSWMSLPKFVAWV